MFAKNKVSVDRVRENRNENVDLQEIRVGAGCAKENRIDVDHMQKTRISVAYKQQNR